MVFDHKSYQLRAFLLKLCLMAHPLLHNIQAMFGGER
jgi:hypothetical protein